MTTQTKLLAADNDRDMLEYLHDAFSSQVNVCDNCGHETATSECDSASDLRDYLAAAPASPQAAQPVTGIEGMPMYLILFDDAEVPVETMFGEEIARKRFAQISGNWNAHLFVKVESNSRDDRHAGANHVCTHADAGEVQSPEYQTLAVKACKQEADIRALRAALLFYANRDHFSTEEMDAWDSCSGEPSNILWHEEEPWFIEDGEIARVALSTTAKPEADHE